MNASAFLRRRWPAVALVASLLLNGFLLGMVTTSEFRSHKPFNGARFANFELRRIDEKLPKPAVAQVASALKPITPQLDERLARLRAIRAEILRLAAAPDPDRAAIDAKLAELRAETVGMQETVQKATYDAVLNLTPDERAALDDPSGS
jgi:uncharacterized membrane protein